MWIGLVNHIRKINAVQIYFWMCAILWSILTVLYLERIERKKNEVSSMITNWTQGDMKVQCSCCCYYYYSCVYVWVSFWWQNTPYCIWRYAILSFTLELTLFWLNIKSNTILKKELWEFHLITHYFVNFIIFLRKDFSDVSWGPIIVTKMVFFKKRDISKLRKLNYHFRQN